MNARDMFCQTPLLCAVGSGYFSPRVLRLLVDAGVDTTSAVRLTDTTGSEVVITETPLSPTARSARKRWCRGNSLQRTSFTAGGDPSPAVARGGSSRGIMAVAYP